MSDFEHLLAPIREDAPCGEDLSFAPELDAIARARQADDPTLDQGAWVTALKEADWSAVVQRCTDLLAKRSKDLQLTVWLAEAHARQGDGAGLAGCLRLIAGLCDSYWELLHPLPDEGGFERRVGNLCWLATQLSGWIHALDTADGLAQAVHALEAVVDRRLGADGPSFTPALAALERFPDVSEQAAPCVPSESGGAASALANRAQVVGQLRAVAAWFRTHEPHSPVAYLAERAARWADQSLEEWLRGVIKDRATLAHLEETLGLGSQASQD